MFPDELKPEVEQLNSLVYWFPILKEIRMRVPETRIVYSGYVPLYSLTDGEKPEGIDNLVAKIDFEVMQLGGYPVFMRTGQTSDKHGWEKTCYLTGKDKIVGNLAGLAETSIMANIAGAPLSMDFVVVRKLLETEPILTHFHGNMPIAKELRYFIKDGKIQCVHPYWHKEVFEGNDAAVEKSKTLESFTDEEMTEPNLMASYIAKYFSGYWSVDFLQTKNGDWYCIDMAVGERSYHKPDCKYSSK